MTSILAQAENNIEELLQLFLKKYVAYLPLWTPILTFKELPGNATLKDKQKYNRSNNGMIESYHHIKKTLIADCKFVGDVRTVRLDDYIVHIHIPYVESIINQYVHQIPSNRNARIERQKNKKN